MAAVDTTRTASHGLSVGSRLNLSLASLSETLKAWNDARLTRRALSRLSDRELADIGLSRAEIGDITAQLRA